MTRTFKGCGWGFGEVSEVRISAGITQSSRALFPHTQPESFQSQDRRGKGATRLHFNRTHKNREISCKRRKSKLEEHPDPLKRRPEEHRLGRCRTHLRTRVSARPVRSRLDRPADGTARGNGNKKDALWTHTPSHHRRRRTGIKPSGRHTSRHLSADIEEQNKTDTESQAATVSQTEGGSAD